MTLPLIRLSGPPLALALVLAGSVPAMAASPTDAGVGDTNAGDNGQLGEITVTANKVSSNLQTTPVAVSVLSGATLDREHIANPVDLSNKVPGLTISNAGNYPPNATLRGVGYDGLQNNSASPGVSINQNGVYLGTPVSLFTDFLDVGQVEVLRGPQGTVFGQNSDGGAINVTTAAPQLGKLGGSAELSYGSYQYGRARGTINLPVGQTFALRASAQVTDQNGYMNTPNMAGNKAVGDTHNVITRVDALWKPVDRLSIDVWGEYFHSFAHGSAVKNSVDPLTDPRETSNDYYAPQRITSKIVAGTVAYDLDFATVKSITSYQSLTYRAPWSGDLLDHATAVSLYGVKDQLPINDRFADTWTEEVDLASRPGGRFSWIVGAFYLHTASHINVLEFQQTTPIAYTPTLDPAQAGAMYAAGMNFESISHQRHRSVALYGQATYDITRTLKLTGGLRYTWDRSTAETSSYYATPVPMKSEFNGLTGKVALSWQVAPTNNLYAQFSTGVKPGGTNLNPVAVIIPTAFRNELVRAYEVGSKNEFLNRKLRVNVSAFYNDYRNLQLDSEDPLPYEGGMTNVAKAHVYGIEAEATALLPAGFRIDANAAWMNSKVDSDSYFLDPYIAQGINRTYGIYTAADLAARAAAFENIKGNQLPRVPTFAAGGTLGKTTEIPGVGTLDTSLQLTVRAAHWGRIYNRAGTDRLPMLTLVNFNAHLDIARTRFYTELAVTNLFDVATLTSTYAENFGVGGIYQVFAPPRQVIGRIGFKF
ncbi:TonB-dependent receptor [Novosphingobium nitrogenifigens]|nr:TonB-dependent receptor [Novosphingobium nitrogenifigens]